MHWKYDHWSALLICAYEDIALHKFHLVFQLIWRSKKCIYAIIQMFGVSTFVLLKQIYIFI